MKDIQHINIYFLEASIITHLANCFGQGMESM